MHLNDIQQLRGALLDIPNYLEWEEQKASLSSLPKVEAVSRVFEALQTYLESSDEDMHHKMAKLYEDICSCLEPSLRKAVVHALDKNKTLEEVRASQEMFLCSTKGGCEYECFFLQALPFLMSYLTEMLTTLYQGLFHSIFKRYNMSAFGSRHPRTTVHFHIPPLLSPPLPSPPLPSCSVSTRSILFYLWAQIVNICSELATDDIDKVGHVVTVSLATRHALDNVMVSRVSSNVVS